MYNKWTVQNNVFFYIKSMMIFWLDKSNKNYIKSNQSKSIEDCFYLEIEWMLVNDFLLILYNI